MNLDPALVELTTMWHELPVMVGDAWPGLRPRLLTAVEELANAPAESRDRRARELLALLRDHDPVRKRLALALAGKTMPTDRAAEAGSGPGFHPAAQLARRAGLVQLDEYDLDRSQRWINAATEPDQDGHPDSLVLVFDLTEKPRRLLDAAPLGDLREPDAWPVTLTVRLFSEDADVEPLHDTLTVPREGPSPDRARFRIIPRRAGTLQLRALFFRGNAYVHSVHLNVVGPAVRTRSQGLPRQAICQVRDRGLALHIRRTGDTYAIDVSGSIGHEFGGELSRTAADLDVIAREARRPLQALADRWGPLTEDGPLPGLELTETDYARHTRELAESGCRMFRSLFFVGADRQLKEVGRRIERLLAGDAPRSVQIIEEHPLLPWHLMCPVEHMEDADFWKILGLRHRVDCLPRVDDAGHAIVAPAIDTRSGLNVTLALNRSIDRGGERDLVRGQEEYWRGFEDRGLARVSVRDRRDTVLPALAGQDAPVEILYLYCHAVPHDPDDGGPQYAKLVVEGSDGYILLRSLHDTDGVLPGPPVIVLNACSTAAGSPLSTMGFLAHFVERSRGVLGTEADTPAPFAAAWATTFFDRLLAGEPMGEAVRATRVHFAVKHRNPLGLLYALYCDGDTALTPAVLPAPPQ